MKAYRSTYVVQNVLLIFHMFIWWISKDYRLTIIDFRNDNVFPFTQNNNVSYDKSKLPLRAKIANKWRQIFLINDFTLSTSLS